MGVMDVEHLDGLVGPSDKTKAFLTVYNSLASLVDSYLDMPSLHIINDIPRFDAFMNYAGNQIAKGNIIIPPDISDEDYTKVLKDMLYEFLTLSSEEPWELL